MKVKRSGLPKSLLPSKKSEPDRLAQAATNDAHIITVGGDAAVDPVAKKPSLDAVANDATVGMSANANTADPNSLTLGRPDVDADALPARTPKSETLRPGIDRPAQAAADLPERVESGQWAAREPIVLIEIDPGMSGGYVQNRYDVMIRGRAISAASLEEIRLQVDDRIISTAFYGTPERAAMATMPDDTPARQRGFQFNLPRQASSQPERCLFQIVARTVDGFERTETFTIDVDPEAATAVSIIAGPKWSSTAFDGAPPHVLMYIERGTIDNDGTMSVQGWAIALGPVLAVQLFAGQQRISAARLGGEREDVAAAYPAYPNAKLSGFSLSIRVEAADYHAGTIRAQVICPHGFAQEETIPVERVHRRTASLAAFKSDAMQTALAAGSAGGRFSLLDQPPAHEPKTDFWLDEAPLADGLLALPAASHGFSEPAPTLPARQPPTSEIRMFCDEAEQRSDGSLFVNGWAVCAAGIAQVRVLLDDRHVGLAAIGHDRLDVGAIYADIPMARVSGFKFEHSLPERLCGEHVVTVIVRSAHDGEARSCVPVITQPVVEDPPPVVPAVVLGATEPSAEQAGEFRFQLDAPVLNNGVVIKPISGRLTIEGWLLSRSGIASFEVFLDQQRLGDAHYGLARQDVGAAFPDWPNALRSGYAFHCPPRSLRDGDHMVTLRLRANSGQEMVRRFEITVQKSEDQQDQIGIRRRLTRAEADLMAGLLTDLDYHPAFRFILRSGCAGDHAPVDAGQFVLTLDALRLLTYAHWSVLVLAEDDDVASEMRILIGETMPHLADRFTVLSASDTATWNAPLAGPLAGERTYKADARLYALLTAGDQPGADALLELAMAGGLHRDADMLYADEVRPSPVTQEPEPFFKPDFSPDLLCSMNYLGRPWVVTGALLAKTGATPAGLLLDGEYDLALRCAELARRVHHVPKVLCQRSVAELDRPGQEQAALRRMLTRRMLQGDVLASPIPGTWRVKRAVVSPRQKVSIVIPTCAAHGYIKTCIETLRARTAYPDFEIICVDNISAGDPDCKAWLRQNADKVVEIPGAFNWSAFNNRAAEVADGEFLLFLNDDMEIVQVDWLDAMMEHGQRPEVGITGPQLLYPDGKVQHAGMFLGNNGVGRHAFRFASGEDPCYFGLALTQRNVIAVTGACLLVRRDTFERMGRFDEAHQIVNNDLDFCLRVHRAGLLTVFTPYASLIHHELASRATMKDVFDISHFNTAWKTLFAAGDPYFNPRLSRYADDYRPDDEPVQCIAPGSPLFHPDEIERILVVKLDHIGDFVTALLPIRRLKEIFPKATITVLAGRASRAFSSPEAGIDEFIPFDFYHARSQLGERSLGKDDFVALGKQLRPYRFDLAVDLRKHLSTRDVLKYTGARFLAGFDYLGQFPYLDVSLDWDGDRTLQRKRSHIIDDLLGLVNAIGHATRTDRVVMQPRPAPMPLPDLPAEVQALFVKPVVAVHPGAGNVTKQWPIEHFSALIDLLIERNKVNILLVGGPDEVEVADELSATVLQPNAIASMAGKTSLADLPRVLLNCIMYIGNDSGPKHIAAAIGIPTIGIHSGVVDPVEWGPLGTRAVALRRNMTCSPCYLANADDCPRALACLHFLEPSLVYDAAVMLMRPVAAVTEATGIRIEVPGTQMPDGAASLAERPKSATAAIGAAVAAALLTEAPANLAATNGQAAAFSDARPGTDPSDPRSSADPLPPVDQPVATGKAKSRARRRQSLSLPA